jgi:hypothetical protein
LTSRRCRDRIPVADPCCPKGSSQRAGSTSVDRAAAGSARLVHVGNHCRGQGCAHGAPLAVRFGVVWATRASIMPLPAEFAKSPAGRPAPGAGDLAKSYDGQKKPVSNLE